MNRTLTKIGAALTFGLLFVSSVAAAQVKTSKPTQAIPVAKEPAVVTVHDTVTIVKHDTVTITQLRVNTVRLHDTTTVVKVVEKTPGWMDRGQGLYFGAGAGPYYPSAGLGGGQIPGYAFQGNLGIDPAGSPLGLRLTTVFARPDEAQGSANLGSRPTVANFTGDLKLRLPFFKGAKFPLFSWYAVGGGAVVFSKDLRLESEAGKVVQIPSTKTIEHSFGYDAGAGASLQIGHKREIFLEGRVINFVKSGFESNHQVPVILGVNWFVR